MAITLLQNPSGLYAPQVLGTIVSPAYNPVLYVVSSTNTAQQNFEYIADVYITGTTFAGGASFLRIKTPADPTYGRGAFDVSTILNRYLESDIGDSIYGFQQCSNSILEYQVKFGELYGPSSGVTAYADLTNGAVSYAFNGSLQTLELKDFVAENYVAGLTGTQTNILTNAPSSGTIRTDEDQWINVMSQSSGVIKYANINRWDALGNGGVFRVINYQYHDTATVANRMLRFPSGYNLNSILQSSITNGSVQPIIASDTVKLEIYFTNTDGVRMTESYFVKINSPCTSHNVYRLHFKNKYGAYDSFSFIRASQKSADIKRSSFEKKKGEFKSASSYIYSKTDRFKTNFYNEYKETININSDWITETQSVWLQEMLTSPEIYLDDATHGLIPIDIINTDYIQRQHLTDKIFNLTVDIEYTFNEIRQGA